jgi:hypothetical protein
MAASQFVQLELDCTHSKQTEEQAITLTLIGTGTCLVLHIRILEIAFVTGAGFISLENTVP